MNRYALMVFTVLGLGLGLGAAWFFGVRPEGQRPPPAVGAEPSRQHRDQRDDEPFLARGGAAAATAGLEVEVRDGEQPAAGVEVQLFEFEAVDGEALGRWRAPRSARTLASGVAQFTAVPARRHLVVARLGRPVWAQHDVAAGPTVDRVVLQGVATAQVSGRVVDAETRQPVALAQLVWRPTLDALAPAAATIAGQADSLGRFRLDVPNDGTLVVTAEGYSAKTVEAGELKAGVDVALDAASVAEGVVLVDGQGAPVYGPGAFRNPAEGPGVTTSRSGLFLLPIPAGGVTLEAQRADGRRGILRLHAAPARQTVRGLRLVIDEGTGLAGTVVDSGDQAPVSDATVRLVTEPDGLEVATGTTDGQGHFRFAALPRGRYSLFARHGSGARGRLAGLELPTESTVVLPLTSASTVVGTVANQDGAPATGVEVTLEFPGGLHEPGLRTRTGEFGEFRFDGVMASMVTVRATRPPDRGRERQVYAPPGGTVQVELSFAPPARVVGRVVGATHAYHVSGWSKTGQAQTVTSESGEFALEVTEGRWHVAAFDPNRVVAELDDREVDALGGQDVTVELPAPRERDGGVRSLALPHVADGIAFDNENGSPYRAGLRSGDLVISINGAAIGHSLQAFEKAREAPADYVIRREGSELRFRVAEE